MSCAAVMLAACVQAGKPQYRSKKYWPLITKRALTGAPTVVPLPYAERSNSVRSVTVMPAGACARA